ncbi:MAG: hypothetical protein CL946_06620 [Ectothiorhodospiraceae bacterium]|nr:hypothetical protein [Ectothiorhodospiraceae bacterium]
MQQPNYEYHDYTNHEKLFVEHRYRLKHLEEWKNETVPLIKDILDVQSRQSANISSITKLFWLVFAVTVVRSIAALFI